MLDMEVGKIYIFPVGYFRTLRDLLKVLPANFLQEYRGWCNRIIAINKERRVGIKRCDLEDSYQYFDERYVSDVSNVILINGVLGGL